MKSQRLKTDFARLSDADLEIKAQAIVEALTDNPYFANPVPALAVVTTHISVYSTALSKAQTRDKTEIATKNFTRANLEQTLTALATYVGYTAFGNDSVLISSGFDLAKIPANNPPIPAPENFLVGNGINSGEIISSVNGVAGARSYIHEYTSDPLLETSEWVKQVTTRRKFTYTSLDPGKKYWFRVAAVGPRQQLTYTNAQMRIVV